MGLAKALNIAWSQFGTLDWPTVSSRLSEGCFGAVTYVDRVTADRLPMDADFISPPQPTASPYTTPNPTATPGTPAPGTPPTPTPTETGGYPAPTTDPGGYPPPFPTATPGYP